eukprot:CAMPEP_0178957334 /NCGR_PEP_ID=MMETSP0789-20121207/10849_1 /TAXON_ID=3005 /ORGANISM="Rhizosolenia setigera, Strain CCMP 1694" /LENGTH=658 /DNA_ID=CAMNT_0020639557 /DNA_START=425 /DNA_END=2397 /DNA_ORIENTATION=+
MGSCSSKRIQRTHDSRAKLSLDEKIQYIKHTPFFLYLSQDNIEKFANCFPTEETLASNEVIKLQRKLVYIVAEGELEMSTTIPDFKGKHDTKKYLCKKKLGDIVNLIEAQKEATRKLSMTVSKKLVHLIDELQTTACEKSLLLCANNDMLQQFLEEHPKLKEPINAILKSDIQNSLRNLPFLHDTKESQINLLAAMCRYEAFDENQIVFEENSAGSKLFMVLDGVATVIASSRDKNGRPSSASSASSASCLKNDSDSVRAKAWCRALEFEGMSDRFASKNNDESGGVTSRTSNTSCCGSNEVVLADLAAGSYFGEASLIVDIPRTSSVRTKTKCLFVTVDKTDFENFLKVCPIKESITKVAKERMLSKLGALSIPFLNGIPDETLKTLSDSADIHELSDGELIFKQGDPGDRFYIIIHGQVKIEVFRRKCGDSQLGEIINMSESVYLPSSVFVRDIGKLGAGKYFGEMALVNDKPRNATVSSHGSSILFSIGKEEFLNIFSTNQQAQIEFQLRVLKGSADLSHLLQHPQGAPAFREYLEKSHASENLDFFLKAKEFEETYKKENYVTGKEKKRIGSFTKKSNNNEDERKSLAIRTIEAEAKDIYSTFCTEESEAQINIPSAMLSKIKEQIFDRKTPDLSPNVFSEAKSEIYNILSRDS